MYRRAKRVPVNPPETFSPKTYWEERLAGAYDLQGVGYASLGLPYNRWLYRVRRRVFQTAVRSILSADFSGKVLDVGSGTGFYIDQWKAAGLKDITGSDLTETAVARLREKYPGYRFSLLDIGAGECGFEPESFDYISAFDVFFHIVDTGRYVSAIDNVHALLKSRGWFLWSDNFLQNGRELIAQHQVSRSLDRTTAILREAGFEIVARKPMFWLMNAPIDSKSLLLQKWWRILERLLRTHPGLGSPAGALLYPLELLLVGLLHESPTTEIMVCRKLLQQRKSSV